jgi:Zn-dependent protease
LWVAGDATRQSLGTARSQAEPGNETAGLSRERGLELRLETFTSLAYFKFDSSAESAMPVFYQLNSSRVTLREYSWGVPWILWPLVIPIVVLLKVLRLRLPGSTDDPPVESLREFQVPTDAIPTEVQLKFAPLIAELAQHGFHSLVFHQIVDRRHAANTYWVHLLHRSGQAVARLHYRQWMGATPPKEFYFPMFISEFQDGSFVVSSAGKPDMLTPDSVRMVRIPGVSMETLWKAHQSELSRESMQNKSLVLTHSHQELVELIERHHRAVRDFHVQRGVFEPTKVTGEVVVAHAVGAPIQEMNGQYADATVPSQTIHLDHADVLVELQKLQQHRVSWLNMLLVLAVSVALFLGAGFQNQKWQGLLLIVGVIFIHEMGHFVAMRVFGYRNLRMFFIPFFGAAVTGRNYNVAGWKKAVVSLMGPVPGILLGVIVGIVGIFTKQEPVVGASYLLLGLNGFNLIPVLPLDGGWVLHATLFCRHPLLDVGFKFAAALTLLAAGILGLGRLFVFLGVTMLIGLPAAYRVARIAAMLRKRGVPPNSADAMTIPVETAQLIIPEVKTAFPTGLNPKLTAQYTTQVFESLNADPPHWLVTIGLLGVHGMSLIIALLAALTIAFFTSKQPKHADLVQMAKRKPEHVYTAGSSQSWHGPQAAPQSPGERVILVADFSGKEHAVSAYQSILDQQPANACVTLCGETVLLTLVDPNEELVNRYEQQLKVKASAIGALRSNTPLMFRLAATTPSEEVAKEIKDQFDAYTNIPAFACLIPPWSTSDHRTPEDRAKHEKARRTLLRAIGVAQKAVDDPRCRQAAQAFTDAMRENDKDAAERAARNEAETLSEVVQEKLRVLQSECSDPIDREVVRLYAEVCGENEENPPESSNPNWLRIGKLLGQLELQGDRAVAGETQFSTKHGTANRAANTVELRWLKLETAEAAPAIAEWLSRYQCSNLQYEFDSPAMLDVEVDER